MTTMSDAERKRFDYFWRILDARDARNNEKLSQCDCCGRMRPGCIDTDTGGAFPIDVHACPECLGNDPEDY